jgi:hypothetical protein
MIRVNAQSYRSCLVRGGTSPRLDCGQVNLTALTLSLVAE